MWLTLMYGVNFGSCDGSDQIEWEVELTDEQEKEYLKAVMTGTPLEEIPTFVKICEEAREEIEDYEISNFLDLKDEFTMECLGENEVDPDDLNKLVHSKDKHALQYFNLTGLSDEEISNWDANNLKALPLRKDFIENFEPKNPFESARSLMVYLPELECPEDGEIEDYIRKAFIAGDVSLVEDVVHGQDFYYGNDAIEIALKIAKELGLQEFIEKYEELL